MRHKSSQLINQIKFSVKQKISRKCAIPISSLKVHELLSQRIRTDVQECLEVLRKFMYSEC